MPVQLTASVLNRVFDYLNAKDTARAGGVCKTWKDAADAQETQSRLALVEAFPGALVDPRLSYKAALERQVAYAERNALRPVRELDALIAMNERAVGAANVAQGLHDLIDGSVVLGVGALHALASFGQAYLMHWSRVAHEGADRGRARVARPDSTRGNLRLHEHLSGTLFGALSALTAAPISAWLVGSKAGVDTLCDDMTYAATRIHRGIYTYGRAKWHVEDVNAIKRDLLQDGDALILERARRAQSDNNKELS